MLEILALLVVFGAYLETARRWGGTGWPFVVAGLLGYLVLSSVTALLLGRGLHLLVGGAWLVLVYWSIFLFHGGGRRLPSSWQCPDCRLFNEPTTLVCGCGHPAPGSPLAERWLPRRRRPASLTPASPPGAGRGPKGRAPG